VDEADLAGLADSLIISKPPSSKHFCTILYVIEKASVQEKTGACSTSSAFSGVAVHYDDVCFIFLYPLIHLLYQVKKQMKRWRIVILPIIVWNAIFESAFFVGAFTNIKNPILFWVPFVKEFLYLKIWKLVWENDGDLPIYNHSYTSSPSQTLENS